MLIPSKAGCQPKVHQTFGPTTDQSFCAVGLFAKSMTHKRSFVYCLLVLNHLLYSDEKGYTQRRKLN